MGTTDINLNANTMSSAFKNLLPALNRVLVRKADPITKTKSGLILSQSEKQNIGTIVAVGPGQFSESGSRVPVSYAVGNTVLLPDFAGQSVDLADGEFYLYRDTEILGELTN